MSETIADIITEARGVFDELRKHGYNVVSVDRMADIIDRVEEAHKREREAGAEAAQICGEIGEMVGREEAKNKSVTNCNRLGNAAKMREALEKANEKRISDAVIQSLRDKKLEMAGEIAVKDAEIAELRECLNEAIREKCPFTRMSCKHGETCDYECGTFKWRKALQDEGGAK